MKDYLIYTFFLSIFMIVAVVIAGSNSTDKQENVDQWKVQPYHYIIELEDEWALIRHADGTIVGQVKADTTTAIGRLFYEDNK